MRPPEPCRDCGHPVVLWKSTSGTWHRFTAVAIPYRPGLLGIVAHKRAGWVDAGTAWPEPADALPLHRCPAAELRDVLRPIGDDWADLMAGAPAWVRQQASA